MRAIARYLYNFCEKYDGLLFDLGDIK